MHSAKDMATHHQEQLIDCLMHYVSQEVRAHLMREVPAAYNDYCGREVVKVTLTTDPERVL